MKILMLLSNPFMVDPRVYKEAKSLMDNGHEVTVIVWDRKNDYPEHEVVDNVSLMRIHNKGLMKSLPNDLFRNPFWWRTAYKKGLELYKANQFKFDVVHCHDLDTLWAGVWLKKKLGIKLVYDAHEIFGYMISRNMPKIVVNASFLIEKRLVKNVDHIITVNEPLENYFKSITNKPITIIMNCKDLISEEYQPPKNDVFTICYIGVLSKSRMLPEIVDVIGNMEGVRFIIAGKKENLYEEVKNRCKKYDNIEFLGPIPFNEVIPKTLESDVVVHMVNPADINNRIGLGNKQFEAMVCGRPIIATRRTYAGELTEKENAGLVVEYDSRSLKKAITKFRDNPKLREELGKNALNAAIRKHNWKKQEIKLLKVYRDGDLK